MIRLRLSQAFHILFYICFGWIFLNVVFTTTDNFLLSLLIALIIFGAFYLLHKFTSKVVSGWKASTVLFCFFFSLIIVFLLQSLLGFYLQIDCNAGYWDFDQVYRNAVSYATTGQITNHVYFMRYPNNTFTLVLLSLFYRVIFLISGHTSEMAGVFLNIVAIDFSILMMFFTSRRIYNSHTALFMAFLCFFFTPFYLYVPIFYTDTLSMPFLALGVYLYTVFSITEKRRCWHFLILSFACITLLLGLKVKGTVFLVFIALMAHIYLTLSSKEILISGIVIALTVSLTIISYNYLYDRAELVDTTYSDCYEYPFTHWFMMGLAEGGGYNSTDDSKTRGYNTVTEKKLYNLGQIKKRIEEYGVTGLMKHFTSKATYTTWGDGTLYAGYKLERTPKFETDLQEYVFPDGKYYDYIVYYSQGYWLALFFLIMVSIRSGIRSDKIDIFVYYRIAVFGLFLFLLLWETRSRYLLNYMPVFILLAVNGMENLWQKKRAQT